MAEFRISVELGGLLPASSPLTAELFPTLAYAVRAISEEAHARWVAYASGKTLPGGKVIANRTGEYARSIQLRQIGDFSAEVFSMLAYASAIEEGTPERDMKTMLGSSLKVRLTKDGRRYLIIPFRHNHSNSVLGQQMPKAVENWWKQPWTPSRITGTYDRVSGTGAHDIKTRTALTVPGWRYFWGERLKHSDLAAMGITGKPANRLAGMVNFRAPGGAGGASHSKYLTFRTMVEGGKGWISPAQPGKWPARTVSEELAPIAETAFRRAMEEDIARMLGAPPPV